ncbi:MAG: hypothetical protein AAF928_14910 [Myxococcota bacterium]
MSPLQPVLSSVAETPGVESVFVLDTASRSVVHSIGPFSEAMLTPALGDLAFITGAAKDLAPANGEQQLVLRFRHFTLRLLGGARYGLGVVSARDARDHLVGLAARVAHRQIQSLPVATPAAAAAVPEAREPYETMPSLDPQIPMPSRSPYTTHHRGQGAEAPSRPHPSSRRRGPPHHGPPSSAGAASSPWVRKPKRKRRKRGGGGIWGDD